MADPMKETREFQFPSRIGDAWAQKEEIDREIRSLEKRKKALEKFMKDKLAANLPEDPDERGHYVARMDNVKMTAYNQEYPSYAKAVPEIIERLVPKTKHEEAEEILDKYTSTKFMQKLSYEEPEDDYADV